MATGRRKDNPAISLPKVKPQEPRPRPAALKVIAKAEHDSSSRVTLMLRLSAEAGLRRGEVAQVHIMDLFEDLTGWSLLVHGKGGKERIVPLTDELARAVRRACMANGGFAFPGAINGHLSAGRVGKLVSNALPAGVTMHALRHTFATRAYAASSDLLAVQHLLGHASPSTTQRYVAIDAARLRKVAQAAA
ncbi:tyrosine-type recombinase/integrase [Actinobaculum suis]